ncbi:type II toxin-antitoxin system prevent-host-death family antitoxin [Streptomyces parvulus]|uniref:type II toxin-antitoxin system prevent-host-death family antitoxin n=1 Tax=Streptomyces parvulus TaxID=146923 RepID=UPI003826926D
MWLDGHPTALYRLYDGAETLLYVGISYQPEARFEQHRQDKPWWPQVARRELQWFADRPSAAQAEVDAIRDEDPEHNGTFSSRRDRRTNRDVMAADGVREVSLSLARNRLSALIEGARTGTPTVLLHHGRRRAVLVSADFYERAVAALGDNAQR